MSVKIGGVVSGIDTTSIVKQLMDLQRQPIRQLQAKQENLLDQSDAVGFIKSALQTLQSKLTTIGDPVLFRGKSASVSNSSIGSAVVDANNPSAQSGTYTLEIKQISTQSVYTGGKASAVYNAATPLANDVTLGGLGADILDSSTGQAVFNISTANGISGTFTVTAASTLNSVITDINTTFGAGFASYVGGKLVIQSSAAQGSVTFSNQEGSFLQKTQLFNPPNLQSGLIPGLTPATTIASLTGGAAGDQFRINVGGITYSFNGSDDVSDLTTAVNANAFITGVAISEAVDSATGITRLVFTSQSGSPISASDLSGNLISSLGLTSATNFVGSGVTINAVGPNQLGQRNVSTSTIGSTGTFVINGQTISYSSSDTLQTVLDSITASNANVVASYDSFQDRIVLTSKSLGASSINIGSDTGSFLTNFGLTSGSPTFTAGKSTIFSINGGVDRVSNDATLTESELGLAGVTFTATGAGTTTLKIGANTAGIKSAIDDFINQYNATQNLISSYTFVDVSNPANSGLLANDTTINGLPNQLRQLVGGAFANLADSTRKIRVLEDLGITGNAIDNTLTVSNEALLSKALEENLTEVIDIFTDLSGGDGYKGLRGVLRDTIDGYSLEATGILPRKQTNYSVEVLRIENEIKLLEARILAEQAALEAAFSIFESASAQAKQFSSALDQLGGGSKKK